MSKLPPQPPLKSDYVHHDLRRVGSCLIRVGQEFALALIFGLLPLQTVPAPAVSANFSATYGGGEGVIRCEIKQVQ